MLLHFCQPTKLGSKELGRVKPNGGMIYLREVFFFFFFSLSPLFLTQRPSPRKLLKLPEANQKQK